MSTLYILIPTHNRMNLLQNLIESINKLEFHITLRILILNSGQGLDLLSGLELTNRNLHIRSVEIEGDQLWGQAIMAGIDIIKKEINDFDKVLFLNDDVLVDQKFIDYVESKWNYRHVVESPKIIDVNKEINSGLYKISFLKITNIYESNSNNLANSASGRGLIFDASALKFNIKHLDFLLPHYLFDIIFSFNLVSKGYELHSSPNFTLTSQNIFGAVAFKNANFYTKYFHRKSSLRMISLFWFWILALVILLKKQE
jgi:GT2 family glycosyltransferase